MKEISTQPEPPSLPALLVVAVALLDAGERVLLQRRPPGKAHAGLWEFPGGKVEPGELPEAAACREIAEELGIALRPGDLHPAGFASGPGDAGQASRAIVILLYAARRWRGDPRPHDAQEIAWIAPEAAAALAMPALDYPLAEALCRGLQNKSF